MRAVDLTKMTETDKKRFRSKVITSDQRFGYQLDGCCWGWRGSHKPKGYGRFTFQGHTVAAHRVAYFIYYESLDPHLEVDHTCLTVDCVNPSHLEAVCPLVNRQRRIEHHRRGK